jgi:hypothetical protein
MKRIFVRDQPVVSARMRRAWASSALLLAVCALGAPAQAHHSAAMFDNTKTVTLTGAVKEFHWMNPHAVIEVVVVDAGGVQKVWNIECSTPNILVRRGWGLHSLKTGDMVTLKAHPMRDGGAAAFLLTLNTPAGAVLTDHDY